MSNRESREADNVPVDEMGAEMEYTEVEIEVFSCDEGVGIAFGEDEPAYILSSNEAREVADALATVAGYWDMDEFKKRDRKGAQTFRLMD